MFIKEEIITTPKILQKFGFLMASVFILAFGLILPLLFHKPFVMWPWILGAIFAFPAIIYPNSLKIVYKIWMQIGHILGTINSKIILCLLFFLIITPAGIIFRVFRPDPLNKKFNKDKSYKIISKEYNPKDMEKPY